MHAFIRCTQSLPPRLAIIDGDAENGDTERERERERRNSGKKTGGEADETDGLPFPSNPAGGSEEKKKQKKKKKKKKKHDLLVPRLLLPFVPVATTGGAK
jgi:hypothetical protein